MGGDTIRIFSDWHKIEKNLTAFNCIYLDVIRFAIHFLFGLPKLNYPALLPEYGEKINFDELQEFMNYGKNRY